MRRASSRLLGVARQAASGAAQQEYTAVLDASEWCGRAAWLHPPGAWAAAARFGAPSAAAALQLQPAHLYFAHGISSSGSAQHTAQPAREQQSAAAAANQQQQEQQQQRNCWQCGTQLTSKDLFFCPDCESVQPAHLEAQHFRVFDIDQPTFDIDVAALEQQYKALQRRLHPDKFATASPLEREYAQQQATAINQAYDVLKRPLRRAHYILNQRGLGACEGMTITDPELLMYVMEAREEVDGTPAEDKAALKALLQGNAALEERCIQDLAEAFQAGDLSRAAELTTQLRYITRIREAIVDKL